MRRRWPSHCSCTMCISLAVWLWEKMSHRGMLKLSLPGRPSWKPAVCPPPSYNAERAQKSLHLYLASKSLLDIPLCHHFRGMWHLSCCSQPHKPIHTAYSIETYQPASLMRYDRTIKSTSKLVFNA